jgi:hypothetical protein
MAVVLELDVRMGGAEKQIKDLQNQLDNLKGKAAQAGGKDGLEKLTANGGAMGILNDLTGGLAMKFKDAYEAIQLSNGGLKGMKAAIAATGIGLLVVAAGAIAANWDSIMSSVTGATKEAQKFADITADVVKAEQSQLDILNASDNILKQQGLSEKEILNLKIAQTTETITALEAQIAANKVIKEEQIAAAQRNQDILVGILDFLNWPLRKLLETIDLIGSAFGKDFGLAKAMDEATEYMASFIFDPEEVSEEGDAAVAEMEKTLLNLQNARAGYQISVTNIDKTARDERKKDEEEAEKKKQEDLLKIQQAGHDARLAEETAALARARREREAELEIQFLEEEALTKKNAEELDKRQKDEEKLAAAKKSLTSNTFAFLQVIAETFGKGNEKRARTAFRISKALGLAEASVNTYQAISAVLTDKTLPGPTKFIAAASAGLIGLAQVAKIASTQFNSGGGGGGGGGSIPSMGGDGGGSPQAQSPQAAIDFSFLQNQQPIQTYVIGSEVKTSNEAEQKIKDQSTL